MDREFGISRQMITFRMDMIWTPSLGTSILHGPKKKKKNFQNRMSVLFLFLHTYAHIYVFVKMQRLSRNSGYS